MLKPSNTRSLVVGALLAAVLVIVLLTGWLVWGRTWRSSLRTQALMPRPALARTPSAPTGPFNLKPVRSVLTETDDGFLLSVDGAYDCGNSECTIVLGLGNVQTGSRIGKPVQADALHGTFEFEEKITDEKITDDPTIDWFVAMVDNATHERMALTSGTLKSAPRHE